MGAKELITNPLNEQQVMMLRLLKKPLPEADFAQIRQLVVKLLAQQMDEAIEEWENEHNITADSYDQLSKGHYRSLVN
ncbi:hypothetical protein [Mucilaginibacter celer]|uniref:Uncharacterized protein n=1 Tax=Mucilaginibacter celer TaxID=2305508 RepID=A0A494VQ78_9SPHI|nr:hypothetical protein [Mucilaginibacter celer]AYL97667.1 hypothetical protein HYN43_021270 [Mucilaginibacter celer]